jgi:sarcosine oxidase subunit gamma
MAEAALRRDAFDGLAPLIIKNRLTVEPALPAERWSLRGPETAAAAVGAVFGLVLPTAINRATAGDGRVAMRLGPDEWLLIASGEETDLGERLQAAPAEPCSLVAVGHRNTGLTVSGAMATEVLSSGVMLDLDPAAFPVGMATRTLFAKAEIVLWRQAEDSFHIEVWRSFAPYLHGLIDEAAREHQRS